MLTICMGGWMRVQLLDWNVWENMSHKETNCALGVKFDIQTTNKPFYNTTCLRESGNSAINCIVCLLDACKVFAHISSKLWQVKKKKQFQHEKSCSSPWQGVYIHCWADMANLDLLQDWKGKFHKNKRTMFYFFFDNNDHSASKKFGPNLLLRFFAYFCHHLGFFMFASLFSQQPQRLQSEFQH